MRAFRSDRSFDVEICVTPEAAPLVIEATWHSTHQTHRNDDGSVTVSFQVDGLEEIVWWLLGWSGVVEVVRPSELRALLRNKLELGLELNQ
jgi:predicted DNA-binding transcriptional regulator YafY